MRADEQGVPLPFAVALSTLAALLASLYPLPAWLLPARPDWLVLVVVFTFVGVWNDFLQPLIYLNDPNLFTISLGLSFFQDVRDTNWNLLMAGSLMASIPPLLLFFFAQRQLIGGIAIEGLKG